MSLDGGACQWLRPDANPIFFAEPGSAGHRRALALCAQCPVRRECLEQALRFERVVIFLTPESEEAWRTSQSPYQKHTSSDPPTGTWAGTTFKERSLTRHHKTCTKRKTHRACVPDAERVQILEEKVYAKFKRIGLEFGPPPQHERETA